MLAWLGSRCETSTKAMPLSAGDVAEELLEGLQAAGGSAQADNGEVAIVGWFQAESIELIGFYSGSLRYGLCCADAEVAADMSESIGFNSVLSE